ncbi:hypothetical protein ACP70R_024687 [Stipagrostis hirtigluma subsp. patula]
MAAVLAVFASKLAGILAGMAKEEVEMLLGVPGEISKLETTLRDLSSILGDAERRRIRDLAVEGWVRDLKDVMYDADDILDLCQIMEGRLHISSSTTAPKTTSGCCNIPTMLFCFRNPVFSLKIGKKIRALNQRLLDIEKRSSCFGFITEAIINSSSYCANNIASSWSGCNQQTGPDYIQSDVVGEKVEESKGKLVDLLIKKKDACVGSDNNNVIVAAAITGTGGIGKTTLARMVFNDTQVMKSFDEVIWLSVNKEYNEINVLRRVIAAFGGDYTHLPGDKALLHNVLKQAVQRKKFLLLMDDVWSENVWNELLRVPLSNHGGSGSKVLVTTRNDGVAARMKAQHIHRVDKLETEDAWLLLKKQVVSNASDESEVDGLKDIGTKIVEKCDGLPLAIKVLGGHLLSISRTRDAWVNVCNHFAWSTLGIDDDINKAVYLSFEELPSPVKQCFMYCSLFPKDQLIRESDIIQLWIAEGCVQKINSKLPEDLGLQYYKELVSRNLLEPDKTSYSISACTMHDVVRSFAQYVAKDEGLLLNEEQSVKRIHSTLKLRHLSVSTKAVEWNTLQKQDSLRTLMLFGCSSVKLKDLLKNLSCLRVLYLDRVYLAELPNSICHLKHLRYLSVFNTSISTIPEGIGDLTFLQTIVVAWCTNVCQLPNSILKLRKLRSINIHGTGITSVPRGFGKLDDLVSMWGFPTNSEDSTGGWCSLEELGLLSKLKELSINALEKTPSGSMAASAKLSSKHHLVDLNLMFTSKLGYNGEVECNISKEEHDRIEEVLANLYPPTCIQELTMKGYYGCGLPKWMRTMSMFGSLRWLDLVDYACCTQLPKGLGQLPFLDYFWVKRAPSVQCIGQDLLLPSFGGDGDGKGKTPVTTRTRIDERQPHHIFRGAPVAFPKLKRLGFVGMLGWTQWDWEEQIAAMPVLEGFMIDSCKLQHLPPGLARHAGRLTHMCLRDVRRLVSVENFPSVVEMKLYDNPTLERISNCPSLQMIDIASCPAVKVLEDLPALRSVEWWDVTAEALPEYLRGANLNKLRIDCSLSLLKLIALRDDTSEWGKIKNVLQLKAYGRWKSEEHGYIHYTKEPYSFDFEADMGESTEDEDQEDLKVEVEEDDVVMRE